MQIEVGWQFAAVAEVHSAVAGKIDHRIYCFVYGYRLVRMAVEEGIAAPLCLGTEMSSFAGINKQLEGQR